VNRLALVTGCAGFIGSHLCERLLADGWQVLGVDAFTDYYEREAKEANLAAAGGDPRFALEELDLATAPLDALVRSRPVVFHLAAQPGVRGSFGEGFARYVHDNVLATQRVFEAALAAGCPRVVWASSSSVYGDAPAYPCRERSTPTGPRSPYGVTKRACEDLAGVYRSRGLAAVGLRYFTVYGPRQRPDMAIRRLCEALAGGPRFRLHGDGSQIRDFTYVADAVDATVRAAAAAEPPELLNVGGGEEASLAAMIAGLEEHAGRRLPLERGPAQAGDVMRTAADTTLARRSLGWTPRVGLRDGLRRELAWVIDRRVSPESPPRGVPDFVAFGA